MCCLAIVILGVLQIPAHGHTRYCFAPMLTACVSLYRITTRGSATRVMQADAHMVQLGSQIRWSLPEWSLARSGSQDSSTCDGMPVLILDIILQHELCSR